MIFLFHCFHEIFSSEGTKPHCHSVYITVYYGNSLAHIFGQKFREITRLHFVKFLLSMTLWKFLTFLPSSFLCERNYGKIRVSKTAIFCFRGSEFEFHHNFKGPNMNAKVKILFFFVNGSKKKRNDIAEIL